MRLRVCQLALGTTVRVQVQLVNTYGAAAGIVYLQLSLSPRPARARSAAEERGLIEVVAIAAENVPPPPSLGDKGSPFLRVHVAGIAKRTCAHRDAHASPVCRKVCASSCRARAQAVRRW